MDGDTNYWGLFAMPVGLIICFGPAIVVWFIEECGIGSKSGERK